MCSLVYPHSVGVSVPAPPPTLFDCGMTQITGQGDPLHECGDVSDALRIRQLASHPSGMDHPEGTYCAICHQIQHIGEVVGCTCSQCGQEVCETCLEEIDSITQARIGKKMAICSVECLGEFDSTFAPSCAPDGARKRKKRRMCK